jgi:hypothetical protein
MSSVIAASLNPRKARAVRTSLAAALIAAVPTPAPAARRTKAGPRHRKFRVRATPQRLS